MYLINFIEFYQKQRQLNSFITNTLVLVILAFDLLNNRHLEQEENFHPKNQQNKNVERLNTNRMVGVAKV